MIARADFGALVTEALGGFTWSDNSHRSRISPWSNDPVCDPAGEALYLRDDADGRFVALSGAEGAWRARHGQGYTRFEHARWETLDVALTVFLDPEHPAKTWRVEVTNRGAARGLSLFACVDWVLGSQRERSEATLVTSVEPALRAILATDHAGEHSARCGFLCASRELRGVTGDRREFYGTRDARTSPRALSRPRLSGRVGGGLDPVRRACRSRSTSVKTSARSPTSRSARRRRRRRPARTAKPSRAATTGTPRSTARARRGTRSSVACRSARPTPRST